MGECCIRVTERAVAAVRERDRPVPGMVLTQTIGLWRSENNGKGPAQTRTRPLFLAPASSRALLHDYSTGGISRRVKLQTDAKQTSYQRSLLRVSRFFQLLTD